MGSINPIFREAAVMISRLTLLSLFTILPEIYGGVYYRYSPIKSVYKSAINYPTKSVLETLVGDPRFSTLVTAVTTAFPDPGAVLDMWPPSPYSPPPTRSLLRSLQTLLVPFLQTRRDSRPFSSGTLSPRRGCMWATAPRLCLRQMEGASPCRGSRSPHQLGQLMS